MKQDLSHLLGLGDHRQDAHRGTTVVADQGAPAVRFAATLSAHKCACRARAAAWEVGLVDLGDEPCPFRPRLSGGDGGFGVLWIYRADANGGLRRVILFPSLRGEAHQVGFTLPGSPGAGLSLFAAQPAAGLGKILALRVERKGGILYIRWSWEIA